MPVPPRIDRVTYNTLRDNLMSYYRTTGRWKHLDEAQRRIAYLTKAFGNVKVVTITAARIRQYAEKRLSEKIPSSGEANVTVAPATVNRELAMLRRMLRLGANDGLVARVPKIEMLREANARAGFVDEAQFRSLSRALRADLRVVVAIGYAFGWRIRSEVLTLERRQVDMDHGTLRLDAGSTKNREGRVVYLTPSLREALRAQLQRVDELQKKLERVIPFVFPHLAGRHKGERIIEFRKAWRKATRAAGLPGLLVHDLRRSAVRNMERASVPRSVAMKVTGHRTESVYRRYAIVSDADLQDASRRIASVETDAMTHSVDTLRGTLTPRSRKGVR